MPNEIQAFRGFMDFALGFDSVTGAVRGQAVTRTPAGPVPGGDGQTVKFQVSSKTSQHDVQDTLGVSVEAAAAFLNGGGSANFDFSESSSMHSFSVYLLVTSFVTNASTHMLNEELRDGPPKTLIAGGNMDRFSQEFGDRYIKGIETGGTFCALIEIQTTDTTDQKDVAFSVSVDAFIGGGAEDLKSHFRSSSMESLSNHQISINGTQVGGKGATSRQFLTADEMLEAAVTFATTVLTDPVPYRVELQDYQSLDMPPPPNAADIQNAKDVIADCAERRASWLQFRNDISFILQHPEQFETPSSGLSDLDDKAAANLDQIKQRASACLNDLKACQFVTVPEPDRSVLPKRKAGAEDPFASQAADGLSVARQDPLAMAIRASLLGLQQRGFDLGMAVAKGQTLMGIGKDAFIAHLPTTDEQAGCTLAVSFSVDRNRNATTARAGQSVAQANPIVANARNAEPPGLFTLGFDIASGIFGDPDPAHGGAQGHTSEGPGAKNIMLELSDEAQRGYRTSRDLNLGPPLLRSKP